MADFARLRRAGLTLGVLALFASLSTPVYAGHTQATQMPLDTAGAAPPAAAMTQTDFHWVPTWCASPAPNADPVPTLSDVTVRQIVHTSAGGHDVRIRLSNAYGTQPLHIDAEAVARRASGSAIIAGSSAPVTFAGQSDVTVAPGAYVLSDPLAFDVPARADLAVSLYVAAPTPADTVHGTQRDAVYAAPGNVVNAVTLPAETTLPTGQDWLWLSEVEVAHSPASQTVIAFGDSITDGYRLKPDSNTTWPDQLATRFAAAGLPLAVVNGGISGNRLLHNGQWAPFRVAGLARFDRDVLAQPNVKAVIVLIGINDIGQVVKGVNDKEFVSAKAIEHGLVQLAERAHERHIQIYAATLTPFAVTTIKNYYSKKKDVERQAINAWIRRNTVFDGVIDFDRAVEDPAAPGQMLPAYDSGDHLHPSAAGDTAMANAVPLDLFR